MSGRYAKSITGANGFVDLRSRTATSSCPRWSCSDPSARSLPSDHAAPLACRTSAKSRGPLRRMQPTAPRWWSFPRPDGGDPVTKHGRRWLPEHRRL